MKINGILTTIVLLSFFLLYGCRNRTARIEDEVTESVVQDTIYPEFRWEICIDSLDIHSGIIGRNEVLSTILGRHGVGASVLHEVETVSKDIFNVRRLQAGKTYHVLTDRDSAMTARYFVYEISAVDYAVYSLTDSIFNYVGQAKTDTLYKSVSGIIESSLWNAMTANGAAPDLTGQLADIYSWTIDFFGIQRGDSFNVYYEDIYIDTTRVATGNILAANFITGGSDHFAFRYHYNNGRGEYFDQNGTSLRRAFLKAPLNFSRISSRFSNARRHPITKIVRPHHGVDYAAPSGTPVYSVGDGTVIARGWDSNGGGNYIRIRHNSTYVTLYMHLRGFASGIHQGTKVSQGQLIGYVGATGMATGPHLDYRVYKDGTAIDPLRMDLPAVDPIKEQDLPAYWDSIRPLMKILTGTESPLDSLQAVALSAGSADPLNTSYQ